ncbi:MAG TPA: hypothetical protein VGZ47_14175 [Gemmataceae bacterium]|nr:hypothetical protein [Gemmataceae bacterium]
MREVNPAVADDEPVLSVKFDAESGEVHVTRSILCYAWQAYADEQGAIQSRETLKRNRELVGSLQFSNYRAYDELQADLTETLFLAVIGISRLPLTSEEAPHPAFTFGQWMYCFRSDAGDSHCSDIAEWITRSLWQELSWRCKGRLLEFVIRASAQDKIDGLAEQWLRQWSATRHSADDLLQLFRVLFEEISLSPYTDFVTKFLSFVQALVQRQYVSPSDEVDFLTFQLRLLWRHLNAFDLVRFHHRGANYPDALLLDEFLHRLRAIVNSIPDLLLTDAHDNAAAEKKKRLRRRGVRQGWFLRCHYEGLAVPELPTSPGENNRVLPRPFRRLPDEEILNPAKRPRHLFAESGSELFLSGSMREILSQSIRNLDDTEELQELGTALFLDRPLGVGKRPGELDRTPLLSYVAFSRKLAHERLRQLAACSGLEPLRSKQDQLHLRLNSTEFSMGVSRANAVPLQRPGVACLEDAFLVADDFVFLRSTRRSLQEFLHWFDLTRLAANGDSQILLSGRCLLLRDDQRTGEVWVYDEKWQKRMRLEADFRQGWIAKPGCELPRGGLAAYFLDPESSVEVPVKSSLHCKGNQP